MAEQKTHSMSDRVHQFRIFIQVAEMGSFIGAARALKLPPANVSAAIRLLENELGVRLLHRTTRQVKATQDGERLLPMARKIASDLDDIYKALKADQQTISGKLNLDVPNRIASRMIAPALPSFLEMYPALELNVSSSDRHVDLLKEGIDCVIRVGAPHDESLICRPLGLLEMVNCASPKYLEEHPAPRHPDELIKHWAVGYQPFANMHHPAEWNCINMPGSLRMIPMAHRIVVNNVESYLACCKAGMGMIQMPRFDVRHLLDNGELVEVLHDWPAPPMPIAALYPYRNQRLPRMTAFIDWFQDLLNRTVA